MILMKREMRTRAMWRKAVESLRAQFRSPKGEE